MEKWKSIIKEKKLLFDMLNVIIGIGILILIVLFILFPGNGLILVLLFMASGLINISNGLKLYRDKKRQSAGMCQMTVGMIIVILAIVFIRLGVV